MPPTSTRLRLTPGYERLLTATGILSGDDTATKGVLTGLLRREIERQGELLEEAIKGLEEQILRWPPNPPVRGRRHKLLHQARAQAGGHRLRGPRRGRRRDHRPGARSSGPDGHHRHPADVRHQPGREGAQRRAGREQAQQAPRGRTQGHAQGEGLGHRSTVIRHSRVRLTQVTYRMSRCAESFGHLVQTTSETDNLTPRNNHPAVPEVVPQHAFRNDRSRLNYSVLAHGIPTGQPHLGFDLG